jgi:hypothetical protein
MGRQDEAFVVESFGAEVNEQTALMACCLEVVDGYRKVSIGQGRDCFEFDDDLTVAEKIRNEVRDQSHAALVDWNRILGDEGYVAAREFDGERFLIDRL